MPATFGLIGIAVALFSWPGDDASRVQSARAQESASPAPAKNPLKSGWDVKVTLPITPDVVDLLLDQFEEIAESHREEVEAAKAAGGNAKQQPVDPLAEFAGLAAKPGDAPPPVERRKTVVLTFDTATSSGAATRFEDALRLARGMTSPYVRGLKFVAVVPGELRGHAILPVLTCDLLMVGSAASLGDATISQPGVDGDKMMIDAYRELATKRGGVPLPIVEALVRPSIELVYVTMIDGKTQFIAGEQLIELRQQNPGWREDVWAAATQPLIMKTEPLIASGVAAAIADSPDAARGELGLEELRSASEVFASLAEPIGRLLDIRGAISPDRARRWERDLVRTAESGEATMWLIDIDSPGGDLASSVRLAGTLAGPDDPIRKSVGFVSGRAIGDAALIATACRPLYLHPDATLGGPGGSSPSQAQIEELGETIAQNASRSRRSGALLKGLLSPAIEVYRYTSRRTGETRYATPDEIAADPETANNPKAWRQWERVELAEGITANRAIELGLADGLSETIADAATQVGLAAPPPSVTGGGIIRFVEWLGGRTGFAPLLLLIGMVMLTIEVGTPGVSIPGFISLVCFALYFWIQFLSGTAQWLEILAFALGIACLLIEVLVLPGFGAFGIGGLALIVIGLVLSSQTFVFPRNSYQLGEMTRNLWLLIASAAVVMAALSFLKYLLPQTRWMRNLALAVPDDEALDRAERLTDYEHLLGKIGMATTPLMPAGRARFGDQQVQVVTDGTPVAAGVDVRVVDVMGNRVVVKPLGG